jgi:tetratricopeptide (TPR) repeat protein
MQKKSGLSIIFAILSLAFCFPAARAADDVLMVLPFDNASGRSEYQWVSDSFAILLSDLLDTPGLAVLSAEERVLACARAGLRPCDTLTLAAKLRLAETAQANLVLVGSYEITGEKDAITISFAAKLIEPRAGRVVGKPFNIGGPLTDLQAMQGLLAWNILYERDAALPYSQDQFKRRAKRIPPRAFEFFVKGLQSREANSREIFLKRAIKEYNDAESAGHFAQAIYELGLVQFQQQDFAAAAQQFRELVKDDPRYWESQFYSGLTAHLLGQRQESADAYERLTVVLPLVEMLNNAGAAQISNGNLQRAIVHLQRAATSAQQDTMVRFNYGYALWRDKKFESAANELQAVVRLNPKDGEAQFLLAECLLAAGKKAESEMADQEARRWLSENNTYAQWKTKPDKMPSLVRFKMDFNRANFYWLNRQRSSLTKLPPAQAALALQGLERARQFVTEKNDEGALAELQTALNNDPTLADGHFLRAQILERHRETDAAVTSYANAVYWNPRLLAAHVALGKLYLARGDRARALAHSQVALELDAQNSEALAVKKQIEGGK